RFEFPVPTHSRAALVRSQRSGSYWERHDVAQPRELQLPLNGDGAEFADDDRLPWLTVRDAITDLRQPASSEMEAWMNHWRIRGARGYFGHSGSVLDWPAKTIKAGVHGVPGGENAVVDDSGEVRYFTLRELARIQAFPDTYFFC